MKDFEGWDEKPMGLLEVSVVNAIGFNCMDGDLIVLSSSLISPSNGRYTSLHR